MRSTVERIIEHLTDERVSYIAITHVMAWLEVMERLRSVHSGLLITLRCKGV